MREEIISVIAPFIRMNPDQINDHTLIGRRAVASSIVLHRMYARLSEAGYPVADYWGIETLGELLSRFSEQVDSISAPAMPIGKSAKQSWRAQEDVMSIGIDAQPVSDFEEVPDYRTDEFYRLNFNPAEISWCQLQSRPMLSFAGLFAAKEAIIKADNRLINTPFNELVIEHRLSGQPVTEGFQLSITHTNDMAIAVAIPNQFLFSEGFNRELNPKQINKPDRVPERIMIGLALLFSLLALLWSFFR